MTRKIIPIPNSIKNDLTGKTFGRLTVIGYVGRNQFDHFLWLCRCECGGEKVATTSSLNNGRTVACGCYNASKTHGMSNTPEYKAWRQMINRCTKPHNHAYPQYGGRGIKICSRWLESFENFYADMGPRPNDKHSLDRINNDGNYEPHNCRWAVSFDQMNNRRNCHYLTFNGQTLTIKQWAMKMGIGDTTIHQRLKLGWSVERALTETAEHGKRWKNHTSSKTK